MRGRVRTVFLVLLTAGAVMAGMLDGTFQEDTNQLIFQGSHIWSKPSFDSRRMHWIPSGHRINVIQRTDVTVEIEGYVSSWFEVSWFDGEWHEGYLPGQLLSLADRYVNDRDLAEGQLLVGATGVDTNTGEFELAAVLLLDGAQAAAIPFRSGLTSDGNGAFPGYCCGISSSSPQDLEGVEKVFVFSISFYDEGFDSYQRVMLWTGSELFALPLIHSMSMIDEPSDHTRIILPSNENGTPNTIIFSREISEGDETVLEEIRTFHWNGLEVFEATGSSCLRQ